MSIRINVDVIVGYELSEIQKQIGDNVFLKNLEIDEMAESIGLKVFVGDITTHIGLALVSEYDPQKEVAKSFNQNEIEQLTEKVYNAIYSDATGKRPILHVLLNYF